MPRRNVSLDSSGFRIDGRPEPLVAAQFEPFRHNPLYWRRSLEAIKGAGIDYVSIFIAWAFHEVAPGDFDFTGRTNSSRDLKGFLELCEELDVLVFARPGPIIDAEWETRGPAPDVMTLDRLHPRFLDRTRQYIEALSEVLVPAQVTRGGPVALLAVDNEILFPYSTSVEQFDVDGDVYIAYDEPYYREVFQQWLRTRYSTVATLNDELGTSFSSFDQMAVPRFDLDPVGYSYAAFDCLNEKIREFTARCRDIYRTAGIDVPVYTNMKQLLSYIDWPAVADELDSVGLNICMPRDMPGEQSLVARWFYMLQRAQFAFPWSAEFQSGWIGLDDVFGFITEEHSEYMPMAAMAAGIRGMSFFMFVERDDWNWSPVNSMGKVRPGRYSRFKRVVRSLRALPQLDTHLADTGLVWGRHDHQRTYIERDRDWSELPRHWLMVDEEKEPAEWWRTYTSLCAADADFRLWVPGVSPAAAPPFLVYAGGPAAPRNFLESLAAAVDNGSILVLVTDLPTRDLAGSSDPDMVRIAGRLGERATRVAPDGLNQALTELGARRTIHASAPDVWTFAYQAGDTYSIGVWNSSPHPFSGRVTIAVGATGPYELVNPADDEVVWQGEGTPNDVAVSLDAHSATILTLKPSMR